MANRYKKEWIRDTKHGMTQDQITCRAKLQGTQQFQRCVLVACGFAARGSHGSCAVGVGATGHIWELQGPHAPALRHPFTVGCNSMHCMSGPMHDKHRWRARTSENGCVPRMLDSVDVRRRGKQRKRDRQVHSFGRQRRMCVCGPLDHSEQSESRRNFSRRATCCWAHYCHRNWNRRSGPLVGCWPKTVMYSCRMSLRAAWTEGMACLCGLFQLIRSVIAGATSCKLLKQCFLQSSYVFAGCVNWRHDISLRIVSTDLKCCLANFWQNATCSRRMSLRTASTELEKCRQGDMSQYNSFPQMSSTVVVCLCWLLQLTWSVVCRETSYKLLTKCHLQSSHVFAGCFYWVEEV